MIPVHHGRRAHELLEGSRLVVFPGADHEPHLHDPERFADVVLAHLDAPPPVVT
jgi:pimeloyl-ACP methyl ester carboxylesterase